MSIRHTTLVALMAGVVSFPTLANEAGTLQPAPQFGASLAAASVARGIPKAGDVSADGRYVYLGSEAGWSVRPHEMLVQAGKLVHGDSCVHAAAAPQRQLSGPERLLFRETQIGG